MNFFSQILPGVRDLRAPTAAGYLLILAVWMNIEYLPRELTTNPYVANLATVLTGLDQLYLFAGVSVAAYIVGVSLGAIGEGIASMTLALLLLVPILLVTFLALGILVAISVALKWEIVALAICAFALFLVYRCRRYVPPRIAARLSRRVPSRERTHRALIRTLGVIDRIAWVFARVAREWRDRLSPVNAVRREYILSQLAKPLDPSRNDALKRILERTAVRHLEFATLEVATATRYTETESGTLVDLSEKLDAARLDPDSADFLREFLLEMSAEVAQRKLIIGATVDITGMNTALREAIQTGETLLRATQASTFEAYDRLRSEAEFRRSIAVPLALVITSFVVGAIHESQIAGQDPGVYIPITLATCLSATSLLLFVPGVLREAEAERLILLTIQANLIEHRLENLDQGLIFHDKSGSTRRLRAKPTQPAPLWLVLLVVGRMQSLTSVVRSGWRSRKP
jgi:hypothetical protein